MNFLVGLILGVGWLVVGVVNLVRGAHWSMILLDAVLAVFFLVKSFRKVMTEAKAQALEDFEEEKKRRKK